MKIYIPFLGSEKNHIYKSSMGFSGSNTWRYVFTYHINPYDILLGYSLKHRLIELDDGKILTGKPDQFDGKNPWVSG